MADKSNASLLGNIPVASFIQNVSSRSPAPGGGSVAALAGSLGAALGTMVCRLTIGKKKYKDVDEIMRQHEKDMLPIRDILKDLIDKDTDAFDMVMAAFDLPSDTPEEKADKETAIVQASMQAAEVPLEVMKNCLAGAEILTNVAEFGNVNSISDAGVANLCFKTGFEGAKLNVLINIKDLVDSEWKQNIETELHVLTDKFNEIFVKNEKHVTGRLSNG
ncbi:cyclodeaminase/cyclohydrolase family protein [Myxococcota bacterium]|nr:cyclodeaminase/cyclohydrolase family protein [Myxococcota bacterium]MBU1381897.1 cyclodeaminase/cyclohydrolase family protein [Myxococcota bacterium]MBU1497798.1 cyclodeaminase/cyclohydrolase family protein [Myxococcota bacterium]